MPKTTKRAATKRAAKIARAHATDLPKLEVKAPVHRASQEKKAARGLGRYPWLLSLIVLVIAVSIGSLYIYHIGPFAPAAKPKHPVAKVTPVATVTPNTFASSPCNASTVVKQLTNTAPAPTAAQFSANQHTYSKAPGMSIDTSKVYCVGLNTNRGLIVLELDPKIAPNTVNNFVYLAQNHFYDGVKFHRVLPNSIVQTGDPKGDGTGGPGYKFNDEPVKGDYTQGCVAMANSGPNTNGSQFFICTGNDSTTFQKNYNLFGHVTMGMNVAQKIQGPGDDASSKGIAPDVINNATVVAVKP